MDARNETLAQILKFAEQTEEIRMVVQEGSLAKERYVDELSDLDLNFWIEGERDFSAGHWLEQIMETLVAVPLDFPVAKGMRSLIVIFENGVKADFSFWPIEMLAKPFPYYERYLVLLDKENLAKNLTRFLVMDSKEPLSEAVFHDLVDQFYLEAHYVAKFTCRGERFFVFNLEAGMREQYLLPLLDELSRLNGQEPEFSGRHMAEWLEPSWLRKVELFF
ncbi:streptomycin aminoglycoside 6-adenyltransferase [Listeria floridensis FSL S10-1187]|uniref:Streptomycin aminoglycoside 6-adenyltransferase n=1 Tax=Listeria floridensis FSL S10-1187 TaxID=1265817 RepID=A0ABP3AXJ4_9LIST|nr:aminoglycoside 6-adenylyltransferase [Listeria floridensis]EUJ30303.1 streptomycin aminoglycoside 6-adenyltransferase [Listeria floridensis FSL S10-1187]